MQYSSKKYHDYIQIVLITLVDWVCEQDHSLNKEPTQINELALFY